MTLNRRCVALATICLTSMLGACGDDDGGDPGTGTTSSGASASSSTGGEGGATSSTSSGAGGEGGSGGASSSSGSGGASSASGSGGAGGSGGSGGGPVEPFRQVGGFAAPESCYWSPEDRHWYVSNVAGERAPGWISRLDENGTVLDAKWVEGLNDPKGMRAFEGVLYVADINRVVGISLSDRTVTEYRIPGSNYVNDVAVDEATGQVYASDTLAQAIHRFDARNPASAEIFVRFNNVAGPNGILVDGGSLVMAGSGRLAEGGELGQLLSIDLADGAVTRIGDLAGKLDGVEKDGDGFWVSEWSSSKIYRISANGTWTVAYDLAAEHRIGTSADIGFDPERGILCVPDLDATSVSFIAVE
ncbi:hypothetical protein WMF30_07885 [Sorangium sp. So ce134]